MKYSFLSSPGDSPGPGPACCEPHPLSFTGPPATSSASPSIQRAFPSSDFSSCTPEESWDVQNHLHAATKE